MAARWWRADQHGDARAVRSRSRSESCTRPSRGPGKVRFRRSSRILHKALDNVKPRLEVKSRRVGGATYQVPMEVPRTTGALAMRWIVNFARNGKRSMMRISRRRLKDAAAGQGNAIKKRDDTHKMAQANRAFAHFRL